MSSLLSKIKLKKIAILGYGIENQALVEWLFNKKIDCEITICDAQKDLAGKVKLPKNNIKYKLGPNYDKDLEKYDIVSRIAGYPLFKKEIKKAIKVGVEVTSPTKLFFELSPSRNIIGVTGTKGKGTTSGLIFEILSTAGKRAWWGGNIGIPMFGFMNKIKKDDYVVLELSSFQLEDLETSPKYAVITNLSREHLAPADPLNPNFHKTYQNYIQAKLNIIKYQNKNDFAVINKNINISTSTCRRGQYNLGRGKKIYFQKSEIPNRLPGEHNKENIAAATELAKLLNIREAVVKKAVKKFKGLPHRIEFVGEVKGIKYYDDSFATIPESTIIALRSFDAPIILIAGGADKGSNYKKLAQAIKKQVKCIIFLEGEATPRLKNELKRISYNMSNTEEVNSMKNVFRVSRRIVNKNDIVLLSPACASFGLFKNYKERGNMFKQEVRKLV